MKEIKLIGIRGQEIEFYFHEDLLHLKVGDAVMVTEGEQNYVYVISKLCRRENNIATAYFLCALVAEQAVFIDLPKLSIGATVQPIEIERLKEFFVKDQVDGVRLNCFTLANLNVPFSPTAEQVFAKHFGVFGCTGSGKSWSFAQIIEQCQKYSSKIILIDPAGEYVGFRRCVSLGFGEKGCHEYALPYQDLLETDLFSLFQPTDGVHFAKLKSAIKSLKLAKLEQKLSVGGFILKAHREKKEFNKAYQRYFKQIEDLKCSFDISKLPVQIQNECVFPQQSATEPNYWGGQNSSELAICSPFIGKVESIISDPDLAFIFNPNESTLSLIDIISAFIEEDSKQILRISFANFTTSFGVKEIVVNILARHLFHLARQGSFLKKPLVLLIDEAHQFLSTFALNFVKTFSMSSLEEIAKLSRKFSLCLGISTQQVREISPLITSQLGCFLIHRLNDPTDFEVVRPMLSVASEFSVEQLANLVTGEAILAGVEFERPVRVRVMAPEVKPRSSSADFQTGWSSGRLKSINACDGLDSKKI